jgi:hypothetical protein
MGDVVARHVLVLAKDSSVVALGHRDSELDGLVPFGYQLATAKYAFTMAELMVFGMWPLPNTVFIACLVALNCAPHTPLGLNYVALRKEDRKQSVREVVDDYVIHRHPPLQHTMMKSMC